MFDFKDHVVLVTGAGAGIGQGIAQAFHAAGARVALGDLREAPLKRAASALGDRVFSQTVDVRDEASVAALVAGAEKALGPVTVAIANAGIYPNTPVVDMDVAEWDRVMETNLRGVFLTCRAAARSMMARGAPGKLVTISSGAYASGRAGAAHYCASKAGVVMFTKVLALELAPARINVNCIAPGFVRVDSEMSPLTTEYVEAITRGIPWGRQGTPADIANAALYLASPYADYVTGEVLGVNGGTMAGRSQLPLSTPPAARKEKAR
ncbi:MAG TPA: SDR family NAD(P)-dependent oxidoreductase [Methylomirabilota bacterium]|nr:SDR family NAD(P)-dependent oxidoreductase [Methylomirabilota bacterium]